MPQVDTVDIRTLAPEMGLARALETWGGFSEVFGPARSADAAPWIELSGKAEAAWSLSGGVQGKPVPGLGCHFLRDVTVSGSGYVFSGKRFIREHCHTSDVAMQWLGRDDFPDNPLVTPRQRHVVIEEPVLLLFGPGSSIFGHWLMDFLPRIVVAQHVLGARLNKFTLLLPADTPVWVSYMIAYFCAIPPERIRYYDRMLDEVVCRQVCLPSFAHDGNYNLHPLVRSFYSQFRPRDPAAPQRRICLSRRSQERHTHSYWRIFEARETLERLAVERGFEIVQPELLDFPGQVDLFRNASCVLGEHGSGMHAAIFAEPGTLVATVGANNAIQFQIAAAFEHRSICMRRTEVLENAPGRPFRFTAAEDDLRVFLDRVGEGIAA